MKEIEKVNRGSRLAAEVATAVPEIFQAADNFDSHAVIACQGVPAANDEHATAWRSLLRTVLGPPAFANHGRFETL